MRRVKVPTALALVSDSEAGLTWIGPVAAVTGAGGVGDGAGGGVRATGLGRGGVTAGGLGGGGGGAVTVGVVGAEGDVAAVWPAAIVKVTGTRSVLEKLFGPDSTIYTTAE